MRITVEQKGEKLLKQASSTLKETLRKYNSERRNVLLTLSGGSALSLLNEISGQDLGENITIAVLDERWSYDPSINNFSQIKALKFYDEAQKSGATFFNSTPHLSETRDELADRFNQFILKWLNKNPDGVIVATVGIGEDGHTSGIMPFPDDKDKFNKLFNNDEIFVVGYDATGKNPFVDRVTTTLSFIRKVETAIVYAVGDKKKDALLKVFADEGNLATTPARILKEIKNVHLFTDILI